MKKLFVIGNTLGFKKGGIPWNKGEKPRDIREWQKNNPDKLKKAQQKYSRSHRDKINDRQRAWHKKNPGKGSAYMKKYGNGEANRLRLCYGITLEQRDFMFQSQDGRCGVCGKAINIGKGCHIDHDHTTGKVRALLCLRCNCGIGHFNDNIFLMEKAIAYLKKWI